jgi:hypothetical protein
VSENTRLLPDYLYVQPRHLLTSTPDEHAAHLRYLSADFGWSTNGSAERSEMTSPCGRVTITRDHRQGIPVLRTAARPAIGEPERWHVDLEDNAPLEVLKALTTTVTNGLRRDPDALLGPDGPEAFADLSVAPSRWKLVQQGRLFGYVSLDDQADMVMRPEGSDTPPLDGRPDTAFMMGAGLAASQTTLWTGRFSYGTPLHLVAVCANEFSRTDPAHRSAASVRAFSDELFAELDWHPAPPPPSAGAPRADLPLGRLPGRAR